MLETRFVSTKCDKCQQENNILLSCFVGPDDEFANSVVAVCQNCNEDFAVSFDESMIL